MKKGKLIGKIFGITLVPVLIEAVPADGGLTMRGMIGYELRFWEN